MPVYSAEVEMLMSKDEDANVPENDVSKDAKDSIDAIDIAAQDHLPSDVPAVPAGLLTEEGQGPRREPVRLPHDARVGHGTAKVVAEKIRGYVDGQSQECRDCQKDKTADASTATSTTTSSNIVTGQARRKRKAEDEPE